MTSVAEKSRKSGGDPGQAAERMAKHLLHSVDGRLPDARRYRDVCRALLTARPDANEALLHVMRRAACLIVWTERQDELLAKGQFEDFDVQLYNGATNTLRRLLADIGFDPTDDPATGFDFADDAIEIDGEAEIPADDDDMPANEREVA